MNYLSINGSNFNNTNKQFQTQQPLQQPQQPSQQPLQQQPQQQMQVQQNIMYDSMNDMVMSDYCECETTMFNNGYFSSSIYH